MYSLGPLNSVSVWNELWGLILNYLKIKDKKTNIVIDKIPHWIFLFKIKIIKTAGTKTFWLLSNKHHHLNTYIFLWIIQLNSKIQRAQLPNLISWFLLHFFQSSPKYQIFKDNKPMLKDWLHRIINVTVTFHDNGVVQRQMNIIFQLY